MKSRLFALVIGLSSIGFNTYGQTNTAASQVKSTDMKQFSLLVRVPQTYGGEQAKSVGQQWDNLLEEWKKQGVYVLSFAFPGESYTVSGSEKLVKKETVLSGNLKVVSNLVVQATSIEEAITLAQSCPILSHGGTVEIREIPKHALIRP